MSLLHRAESWPEVHITAAADELLTHLLATGEDVLADKDGAFMTLASIGAQAVMTMAELEGSADRRADRSKVWVFSKTSYSTSRVTPSSVYSC